MVNRRELIAIPARGAFQVLLRGRCLDVALAGRLFLSGSWARVNSATAAVEADSIIAAAYGGVVRVADDVDVYVCHRAVVIKIAAAPVTAGIADARVAESIINAAVEPDLRPPVAGVPAVETACECPIAGSPE
jgi:hypothetical protein